MTNTYLLPQQNGCSAGAVLFLMGFAKNGLFFASLIITTNSCYRVSIGESQTLIAHEVSACVSLWGKYFP